MKNKQLPKKVTPDVQSKIEELLEGCPSDWAKRAAEEMECAVVTVRKIRRGDLGKRDKTLQIRLIKALKSIKADYQHELKQALS